MMAADLEEHRRVLENLVALRVPLVAALQAVRELPWDSPEPVLTLKRLHVVRLLRQYLDETLHDSDVEDWANCVEGREDIDLEAGHEELLAEFIFEAANPTLASPTTPATASSWLGRLAGARS